MKLYFVKGVSKSGDCVVAGHWLADSAAAARIEFAADVARTNIHHDVVAAGLSRDHSGLTWEAKVSKSHASNAMNFKSEAA